MLGLLPLAGLLFLSGELNAYGTAVAELRAGQAPVQAGQPPEAGVAAALTPVGQLEYARLDRQVILDYGPRILWRQPNALDSKRPLVLHVMNLSVTVDATPTVRFIERASASYGQADYTALNQIFAGQGTLPQILDIFAVSAGTGLRWDASARWRYETMFDVEHREILGSTAPQMAVPPPIVTANDPSFRQTNLELDSSGIARIDRRNELVLTTAVSERILHNGVDIFAVTPQVGWRTRLARSTELRFAGGFTYARDLGTNRLIGPSGVVRPVGNAELNGLLVGRRGMAWRGTVGATLDYFVDPFLRAAGPRGTAIARSVLLIEPNWTVGIEGSFATSLRGTPPPMQGLRPFDETTVAVALPVRHRVSASLIVETGLRWSMRAPRIRADDLTFRERQTWFYVSLTATSRRIDEWVATREIAAEIRDEGAFARPQTTDASRQSTDGVQQTQTGGPPAPLQTGGARPSTEDGTPATTTGTASPATTGP